MRWQISTASIKKKRIILQKHYKSIYLNDEIVRG
jgi:hypothetical protein